MDYDLGVWVLCQPHAGAGGFDTDGGADAADDDGGTFADVSAETFEAEHDVEHDARHPSRGARQLAPRYPTQHRNPKHINHRMQNYGRY